MRTGISSTVNSTDRAHMESCRSEPNGMIQGVLHWNGEEILVWYERRG